MLPIFAAQSQIRGRIITEIMQLFFTWMLHFYRFGLFQGKWASVCEEEQRLSRRFNPFNNRLGMLKRLSGIFGRA